MKKELVILAMLVCAVLADNYWCPNPGQPFECFESAPDARFCVTKDRQSKVICSKCRRKYEFCKSKLQVSKYPDRDCGKGWESTACTSENSEVPSIFS